MEWYYAVNGKRVGPISEANFSQLVANGAIADDTLVWHKGMTEWTAWEAIAAQTTLPPAERLATAPGFASEQREAEEGEAWTAESFWAGLQANGFTTSVGGCFGRAWQVYKAAFWACLGVTLLGYFVLMVVGFIPLVGLLSIFLATPQINGGIIQYFIERSRGGTPGVETIFVGYSQGFGSLAGVGAMQVVFAIVPVIILAATMSSMGLLAENPDLDLSGPAALGGAAVIMVMGLIMIFITLRILLAPVFVIDLGATTMEALKMSWRVVGMRFWTLLGLCLILGLLAFAGMLALFIGLLFVMPMYPAVIAQYYEDARNSAAGQPPVE
jgi:hypothetical protein